MWLTDSRRSARAEVADFWDEVLARWLSDQHHLVGPLQKWKGSYQCHGGGAVDLAHHPDPCVGDLGGLHHEPRLVLLDLNPGIGYEQLQGPHGICSQRIRQRGYSYCLSAAPGGPHVVDRAALQSERVLGALARFARRWLQDPTAGVGDILKFERYPWHSNEVNAPLKPPPALIDQYVWQPVHEVDVPVVFAFGAAWIPIQLGSRSSGSSAFSTRRFCSTARR